MSIHRLTQAVIWHQLTTTQRDQTRTYAADLLDWALPADPRARANWPRYLRLLPHARAVTPPGSHTMHKVIDFADASGDYATAKTLQQARYTAQAEALGPEHRETLIARANLASWTGRAGGGGDRPRHVRRAAARPRTRSWPRPSRHAERPRRPRPLE
ncbi:hypothetical protein ACIBEJ_51725 [Nonomuraea sp. NPDC050790]|uniref:hypothetical protein n=1 Tax=Nonomuraea sp. NPDC050790 TaxID=3364371 RepID=UPI0037894749